MNEPSATITLEQYDNFKNQENQLNNAKTLLFEKDKEIFDLWNLVNKICEQGNFSHRNLSNIFEKCGVDKDRFFEYYNNKKILS